MEQTLRQFTEGNLFDATQLLLRKLNIQHTQEEPSPLHYADYYDNAIPQYVQKALALTSAYYYIGEVCDEALQGKTDADTDLRNDLEKVRANAHYKSMMLFAVDLRPDAHVTRTDLAVLTRAFNRLVYNFPVTVIFRQSHLLSIGTCERTEFKQEWRQGQGEKLGRVSMLRNIDCWKLHRGYKDILDSIGDKNYPTFDELYKHWLKVFSSELLTEKFYEELQNWYFWAVRNVEFPNDINDDADDRKYNSENVIRLITRFIFVWFLKEKGLVNPDLFDEKKLEGVLKDFNPQSKEGNYYVAIIQNLFFATLNQEIANRQFVAKWDPNHHGIKTLYRNKRLFIDEDDEKKILSLFSQSPYVNGSLFECLDDKERDGRTFCWDGFSESKTTKDGKLKQAVVPNYLFFRAEKAEEVDMQVEYNKDAPYIVKVSGLLNILDRYHFTIEENTPLDEDVALDPELLGRAFENLLGAFNPETKTTARENTGSYYTPRDIVNYMASESLLAHLETNCPNVPKAVLAPLLDYNKTEKPEGMTEQQVKEVVEAVYHCKVLDPACGSGAFPIGMLQLLVHILRKLDDNNKYWYKIVLEQALEEVKLAGQESEEERQRLTEEINQAFDDKVNDPDYARKLYIIEKCIYGVDIQTVAVQISRLRCFISLLCEQPTNNRPEDNYGIKPLPNLETNFVAANTLFSLHLTKEEEKLLREEEVAHLTDQLREVRHLLFLPRDKRMKARLRKKDEKLREQIKAKVEEIYNRRLKEAIEQQEEAIAAITIWLDSEGADMEDFKMVAVQEYDIFGNLNTKMTKQPTKKTVMKAKLMQAEKEKERLEHDTRLAQIKNKIDQLVSWDPFDQNVSSPFFEPEWMFGVADRFSIVIGNPPYISAPDQLKDEVLRKQRERLGKDERYNTLYQKWDLYIAFLELGIRHLTKERGILSMIVPYPLTNQLYGRKIREYFLKEEDLLEVVDLNGIKVFKSVTVSNCIPFVRRSHSLCETQISKGRKEEHIQIAFAFEQPHDKLVQDEKTQVWNLTEEDRKTNRHEGMHVLGDYCYISEGMKLNADEKVARGEFTKADLISLIKDDLHTREYYEGKDIEKYYLKHAPRYLEYGTARVPSKLRRPTFPELYSNTKLMFNILGDMRCVYDDNQILHSTSIMSAVLWCKLHDVENKSIASSIKKFCTMSRKEMELLSQNTDLRFIMGVMNSQYASVLLTNNRGDDYHIYAEYIRNIPIPSATKEQQQPIIELVDKILAAKKENPAADTIAWEQEIDRLVYELYGVNSDTSGTE